MNVLEAMDDPQLFGRWFRSEKWWPWRAALAALFGLSEELRDRALTLYVDSTRRKALPSGPAREGWLIVGRRGGKSLIAAFVAVYTACFRDYSAVLAPGERGTLMVLAADRRQARVVFGYIEGFIDGVPMLKKLVESRTKEAIHLTNGISIEVHAANFRSVRGYTLVGVICDELAFWRSDDSANPDSEILNALRPGMATVPDALLLVISSPYARRGELWKAYREHAGQKGDVLVWQAPSATMNPTLDPKLIERAYADDPVAAGAEYGAEFRADVESLVTREVVEAAVVPGRFELPPDRKARHVAFCDPSGGSSDSMTLAIAHAEGPTEARVGVLDCLREVRPPFNPEQVVAEFASLLKRYGARRVRGDRYGAEWVSQSFGRAGITYEPSVRSKSDIYRELLPALNSRRVELLEHPRLLAQLVGLERRTSRGGRESIDHMPGAHDDVANAAAGGLVSALEGSQNLVHVEELRL
jgi:hypothetical protein